MSEKRLYSYDKGNNKILCNLNDVCDFNVLNVFQLLNSLANENEPVSRDTTTRGKFNSIIGQYQEKLHAKLELL